MKSLAWYCFAVGFLCLVSGETQTCQGAFDSTFLFVDTVDTGVSSKFAFKNNNTSEGTVFFSTARRSDGLPCIRMRFDSKRLPLVSIRGGIFSKKELIREPVEYPNRRNVGKVLAKRGLPANTVLTELSLHICHNEILTDDAGCCDGSPLYWIAHAMLRREDGKTVRAEVTTAGDGCELRTAAGPDIVVCRLDVECMSAE
ncbi:hypothetical protein NDN08_004058 [Rhodosorus marinus]|uniref:Secreted protein n=1 Tax=Rhodosorus marinus TaxID=101924 RepID=A0AAV8UL65_9RHOD|nr:hypothetical protein NDN08_004058 [Rhodosorus marinus]